MPFLFEIYHIDFDTIINCFIRKRNFSTKILEKKDNYVIFEYKNDESNSNYLIIFWRKNRNYYIIENFDTLEELNLFLYGIMI